MSVVVGAGHLVVGDVSVEVDLSVLSFSLSGLIEASLVCSSELGSVGQSVHGSRLHGALD